jgi:type 1 fimbriae regulatory protein FimB/type 1 fimbriae regulatory protein FimE
MKHLDRSQLLAVLSEAKKDSSRNWLMLALTYNHGLRVSEVLALTPAHIKDGFLSVRRLKGSLHTTQPLIGSAEPLLDEKTVIIKMEVSGLQNVRLFPVTRQAVHKIFRKYCLRAGVPEHLAHVHVLKHTMCVDAIAKTSIHYVKQWAGHKSLASTGAYLEVTDQQAYTAIFGA